MTRLNWRFLTRTNRETINHRGSSTIIPGEGYINHGGSSTIIPGEGYINHRGSSTIIPGEGDNHPQEFIKYNPK